jgi:hypothetical protein
VQSISPCSSWRQGTQAFGIEFVFFSARDPTQQEHFSLFGEILTIFLFFQPNYLIPYQLSIWVNNHIICILRLEIVDKLVGNEREMIVRANSLDERGTGKSQLLQESAAVPLALLGCCALPRTESQTDVALHRPTHRLRTNQSPHGLCVVRRFARFIC